MKNNRGLMRATAVGAVASMTLVAAPAIAAKPAPRPTWPKGSLVKIATITMSSGSYAVPASWTKATNATSYRVNLKNAAGTTLDADTVTTPSWTAHTDVKVGTQVKVTVTPVNGTRSGANKSSALVALPDLTAPSGDYAVKVVKYTATLSETALSDDSGAANVTRTVNWGDGTATDTLAAATTAGTTASHDYVNQGTYTATVTLKDAAGNQSKVPVAVTVVDKAPHGTFDITQPDPSYNVTVTQTSLGDDITPTADLVRVIDWGDGSAPETMTADTASHQYPNPGTATVRYTPTVTVSDTARPEANSVVVPLRAVVVNDTTAPTGSYTLDRTTAWASYSQVKLTQTALDDGAGSPAAFITRSVDWGDGTVQQWTSGLTLRHRYSTAGSFTPHVTLTDEAGNSTDPALSAGSVTVKKDTTAPKVTDKLPAKPRYYVKKWRTLRGTVKDAGVGARLVRLQVVEKRGSYYYAYKPASRSWVKVGTRLGKALSKAGVAYLRPTSTGTWSKYVSGLRKGTLTYRVKGVDRVGNTSKWLVHSQKLTR